MYDKKLLAELLVRTEYKIVDDNGKILPPSNAYNIIYNNISLAMLQSGSRMTAKHVYTMLKNNRNGLYDHVLRMFKINHDEINVRSKESVLEISNCANINKQTFNLVILAKNWSEIKPSKKMYSKREYVILKSGQWSHIFAEEIWKQTKIICAFSFKRAKVYTAKDAKCYAYFEAKCKQCGAKLKGFFI